MNHATETQAWTQGKRAHAIDFLRQMLRIRRLEERCAELYTQTKIRGFLHLYNGEDAVAVGVVQSLGSDDAIVATYREHGHALVRGTPAREVMAELFGKATGISRGRLRSRFTCWRAVRLVSLRR